ncbi:transposase [Streptosporangium sp. NPDC049644]|uniref:transposase n=1 Tax=Streptosporangium sp. NPDC049644 TaxID=3155507 RepID=UPI00343FF893
MKTIASRPKIVMSSDGSGLISHSGALLLLETLRVTVLDQALSKQLQRWKPARAIHDPGKIIADLAVSLALGGGRLADIATLRSQPELFGGIGCVAARDFSGAVSIRGPLVRRVGARAERRPRRTRRTRCRSTC